jgi:hypothetical protein
MGLATIAFIAATLLSAGPASRAGSLEPERLTFEGLRPDYRANQSVTFAVRSAYSHDVLFSCSVDMLLNGKWQEVIGSIHDPKSKTTRLYRLKPGRRTNLSLNLLSGAPLAGSLSASTYRFRVQAYDPRTVEKRAAQPWSLLADPTPRLETAVSEPFRVVARRPD